jgi:hypothetical protein
MSDFLDEFISHLKEDVNKKSDWLENSLAKTNWKLIDADSTRGINTSPTNDDQSIAAVSKAYTAIENRANLNKLTDSFRTTSNTAFESKTTRSLKETIARFTRQHTIIQAHS